MSALRTRIKICGITRLEDALLGESLGADALGFVFVPKSKRYISFADAAAITSHLGPFTTPVGLFLDAPKEEVLQALEAIPDLFLQFHGQESGEFCDSFNRPYIKALGVGLDMPDASELATFANASAFLFDSNEPGALGGTGHTFDWTRLEDNLPKPLILAGGLNVSNVGSAAINVAPHAVDVSSGVESSKGIKDLVLMREFIAAVMQADQQAARSEQAKKSSLSV